MDTNTSGAGAVPVERAAECHQLRQNFPTDWFELGAQLCLEGRIDPERLERAFEAVRLGVARAD